MKGRSKGRVIDLQVERQKRRPRYLDVDVEAEVSGDRVQVKLVVRGDNGNWVRTRGLIEPAVAHELGALLQRVALAVPPPKKGGR